VTIKTTILAVNGVPSFVSYVATGTKTISNRRIAIVDSRGSGSDFAYISDLYVVGTGTKIPNSCVGAIFDITWAPTTGDAPLTVTFTNNSQSPVDYWEWDFGNGDTYIGRTPPPVTYDTPNTYTVSVRTGSELYGWYEHEYHIVAQVFDFTLTPLGGSAPLTVFATAEVLGEFPVESYLWDFGDGRSSTEEAPEHTYIFPGTYDITLSVVFVGREERTLTKIGYITVVEKEAVDYFSEARWTMDYTTEMRGWRHAILPEQGIGFYEIPLSGGPLPRARTGLVTVLDKKSMARGYVMDYKSGYYYDVTTRNGPDGSGMIKVWKSKVGYDGSGGTDFNRWVAFPHDSGSSERIFIRLLEGHIYVQPYDDTGIPADLELSVDTLVDKESIGAFVANVPITHDIFTDRVAEGNLVQHRVIANGGGHVITGREHIYRSVDKASRVINNNHESQNQKLLAKPSVWVDVLRSTIRSRVTGALTGWTNAVASGTLSRTKSVSLPVLGDYIIVTPSGASTASLLFMAKGTVAVTVGGGGVSVESTLLFDGWYLHYTEEFGTTGEVRIVGGGTVFVEDIRYYAGGLEAEAADYYSFNMINNSGDKVR